MSLCILDLDNTLTYDRTIDRLAERFGRPAVMDVPIGSPVEQDPGERTRDLMAAFADEDADAFEKACRSFQLREGADEAVAGLRRLGFQIGVTSAFFQPAVDRARELLALDFALAAEPEVVAGRMTGRLRDSEHVGICGNLVCNRKVLDAFTGRNGYTVGVSAGYDDRCILAAADLGVAVEPCPIDVRIHADVVVRNLAAIPSVVERRMARPTPMR